MIGGEFNAEYPVAAPAGDDPLRLLYQYNNHEDNIWLAATDANEVPRRVAASTWLDMFPALSPDANQMAFISQRSGTHEVWAADLGQMIPRRLTRQNGPYTDMPRWSPDGRHIAFSSADDDGNRDIYIVDAEGSATQRFTDAPSEEGRASWSRDGTWLYYRSDRSGSPQIWKQRVGVASEQIPAELAAHRITLAAEKAAPVKESRVENEGPIQVTTGGGYEAFESPNGQVLYYIKSRDLRELWSVPSDGGPERPVVTGPRESRWAVTVRGILFLDGPNVRLFNFTSGDVEDLGAVPTGQVPSYGFSASPDGRYFLWSQTDRRTADLWAAEIRLPRNPAF